MIITQIKCDICNSDCSEIGVQNFPIKVEIAGKTRTWSSFTTSEFSIIKPSLIQNEICPTCMKALTEELKRAFEKFFNRKFRA